MDQRISTECFLVSCNNEVVLILLAMEPTFLKDTQSLENWYIKRPKPIVQAIPSSHHICYKINMQVFSEEKLRLGSQCRNSA